MKTIEWAFDKIYRRIADPFGLPHSVYLTKYENLVIDAINQVTKASKKVIKKVLDEYYPEHYRVLYQSKILSDIILGKHVNLITERHTEVAVLNNRLDLEMNREHLSTKSLMIAAKYNYESLYFRLRQLDIDPNISVYYAALNSDNLTIIKDVDKVIAPNKDIILTALETCSEQVAEYLLNQNKIKDSWHHVIVYKQFRSLFDKVVWKNEHYFSALLSGDMEHVKYAEDKLANIHDNHKLDLSNEYKGKSNLLMSETTWFKGGTTYFGHTMNYATQSCELKVVEYVHGLGYGITLSNIVTAIRQGTVEILEYLLDNYHKPIPQYISVYLSVDSFIKDKAKKIKVIFDKINWSKKQSLDDKRREGVHKRIIESTAVSEKVAFYDIDYLMSYGALVGNDAKTYVHVMADRVIMTTNMDMVYLFGNLSLIKKYPTNLHHSKAIIIELLSYGNTAKISYMISKNIIACDYDYYTVALCSANRELMSLFPSYTNELEYVLLSKDKDLIMSHASTITTPEEVDALFSLPHDLRKLFSIADYLHDYVREYAAKNEYEDLLQYLNEASNPVQDPCVV